MKIRDYYTLRSEQKKAIVSGARDCLSCERVKIVKLLFIDCVFFGSFHSSCLFVFNAFIHHMKQAQETQQEKKVRICDNNVMKVIGVLLLWCIMRQMGKCLRCVVFNNHRVIKSIAWWFFRFRWRLDWWINAVNSYAEDSLNSFSFWRTEDSDVVVTVQKLDFLIVLTRNPSETINHVNYEKDSLVGWRRNVNARGIKRNFRHAGAKVVLKLSTLSFVCFMSRSR